MLSMPSLAVTGNGMGTRPRTRIGYAILALAACSVVTCSDQPITRDSSGNPGRVIHDVPEAPRPGETHVFYLHGAIVEDQGVRPVSPEFGVYEYEQILDALASEGLVVISEARPSGTDGREYARKLVGQIEALLAAGVPPRRISVVGFSKGGGIALLASSLLGNEDVRFVFLGTCASWIRTLPELTLRGHILSIYEESDPIGRSCKELLSASDIRPELTELKLDLGERHGTFYRPRPQWLDPVVEWVKNEDRRSQHPRER
jgi:hypothetical protein